MQRNKSISVCLLVLASCQQPANGVETKSFLNLLLFNAGYASVCSSPPDRIVSASNWKNVQTMLQYEMFKGSNGPASVTTFGSPGAATSKWTGGVLAANGKIYGMPRSAGTVLEIDPDTRTLLQFGSIAGLNQYTGGVLAQNGKIYGIPYNATSVLEIDPIARTAVQFGTVSGATGKWEGGVLASNGKIYAMPSSVTTVLEIDPINRVVNQNAAVTGGSFYEIGSVLGPNGKVYGIPYSNAGPAQLMELDPATGSTVLFGPSFPAFSFTSGVLAPNGMIYTVPYTNTAIYEIDPTKRTATAVTGVLVGGYSNGSLAPNGKIYMFPYDAPNTNVLEFDPNTKQMTSIGNNFAGGLANKYEDGVMAPNGKIYTIPRDATNVAEISTGSVGTFCTGLLTSSYLNHY